MIGVDYVISEYDYSIQYGAAFDTPPADQRLFMVADKEWKYVHAIGYRPMLFDLKSDPQELCDLGADPAYADVRRRYADTLAEWGLRSVAARDALRTADQGMRGRAGRRGILIGVWDESDVSDEMWKGYLGDGGG